jgi:serine/threonine protein phosphatase PrpC
MAGETQIMLPAVDVAERSDPGRDPTKQINEDAFGHRETPFGLLAVVCDGMGGHVGGREASNAALATIFEAFDAAPTTSTPREVLRDAIRLANVRVRGLAVSDPAGGHPGSTVVAVLVHAGGTEVAHVGDSRVYLVQQGQIFQITRDHSMVEEMVQAKLLTPEQAAVHPDANKITRALGIDDDVEVEVRGQPVAHVAGDAFLLCSDGLSDLVEKPEMLEIVSSEPPAQAAGKLVDLANARGGYDNITVVIVKPRVSAPAAFGGGPGDVAPTVVGTTVSTTMTLRPPAAPPFSAKPEPLAPASAPVKSSPEPTIVPSTPASKRPLAVGVAVVVGCILAAVALVYVRVARTGKPPRATLSSIDAGPAVVNLGAAPSAAVNLAPADLPQAVDIDAAGVAPLEPVPSAPMRHSRGKLPK